MEIGNKQPLALPETGGPFAFKEKKRFVFVNEEVDRAGEAALRASYGAALIVDGAFSSESKIETHGEL